MGKNVIVTGGAGFIGSHLVKMINQLYPDWNVLVIDNLSYAGNLDNLKGANFDFRKVDISNYDEVYDMKSFNIDAIFHLAAESHVDRSIHDPLQFAKTNVIGTINLLELALKFHLKNENFVFYHVSTDEVFGSLGFDDDKFDERAPYDPRSPYSASKASSDHFVRAYNHTYKLPILISNCSNNYGTHQYPEKLIPVVINSIKDGKNIPLYGSGINVRDWLHVEDHVEAILKIYNSGNIGRTYCIGGDTELTNRELIEKICEIYHQMYGGEDPKRLITKVKDRPGHDLRYAIDYELLRFHTGWEPKRTINEGLEEVIRWYVEEGIYSQKIA
jgi:dTDP-glucose 4,6-dehydratase